MSEEKSLSLPENNSGVLASYGDGELVKALAKRIQYMLPGAGDLDANEVMALAQTAIALDLDPLAGEIWYIPSKKTQGNGGPMVGIRGLRRKAREQMRGRTSYTTSFMPMSPEDRETYQIPDNAVAIWCHLTRGDVMSDQINHMQRLTEMGYTPDEIKQIVPVKPFVGLGVATPDERSKMLIGQRAQKRAEADAIKKAFDIRLPAYVMVEGENGDWVGQIMRSTSATDTSASEHLSDEERHKLAVEAAHRLAPPTGGPLGQEVDNESSQAEGSVDGEVVEESEPDDDDDLVIDPLAEARGMTLEAFGNGDWADRTIGDCNPDQLIWVIEKCQERPKWEAGKRIEEAASLVLDAMIEEDALQDVAVPFASLEWPSEQARERTVSALMLNGLLTPTGSAEEAETLLANAADAGVLDGVDLGDTKAIETVLAEWVEAWKPDDGENGELPGMPEPEKPASKIKGKVN